MKKVILISLVVNFLLSWAVLPLLLPPFRMYTPAELGEALFWQAAGMIGWPLALLGSCANALMQGSSSDLGSLAMLLIYPAMLVLLVRAFLAKRFRKWELVLLHVLILFSFAAVWYQVLNGYNFMTG